MTKLTLEEAKENIYTSLNQDNFEIDKHILALKIAMKEGNVKSVEFDKDKLAQNNRQGRKMMQSYFKKRGVEVKFAEDKEEKSA